MKAYEEYLKRLVENEDFESEKEFEEEVRKNRGEVIEYLEWRLSGGKSLNESFPEGYLEAVKNILRNLYKLNARMNLNKFDACQDFEKFDAAEEEFREKAKDMTKEELLETLCMQLRAEDKFREKAKDMTKEELLETLCMQLRRDMCRSVM